ATSACEVADFLIILQGSNILLHIILTQHVFHFHRQPEVPFHFQLAGHEGGGSVQIAQEQIPEVVQGHLQRAVGICRLALLHLRLSVGQVELVSASSFAADFVLVDRLNPLGRSGLLVQNFFHLLEYFIQSVVFQIFTHFLSPFVCFHMMFAITVLQHRGFYKFKDAAIVTIPRRSPFSGFASCLRRWTKSWRPASTSPPDSPACNRSRRGSERHWSSLPSRPPPQRPWPCCPPRRRILPGRPIPPRARSKGGRRRSWSSCRPA